MDLTLIEAFILSLGAIGFGSMLLVKGGDWTVDAAAFVAHRFGISQLIIGFTILAFGTSLPELIVSMLSHARGSTGIAIGNVLGSNIANIIFIIGFVAMIHPLVKKSKVIARDLIFMLLVTAAFAALLVIGEINQLTGGAMLAVLVSYIGYQYYAATHGEEVPDDSDEDQPEFKSMGRALFFLFLGMIAIAIGAEFLVRGASIGAVAAGVPESVIALSLIAFGTSLPELSTSIIAAKKGHSDMVFGNIIGSNVFNILMIIGAISLMKPISADMFDAQLANFDIWVTFGISIFFAALLMIRKSVGRVVGGVMFAGYILYNIYIYAVNMAL